MMKQMIYYLFVVFCFHPLNVNSGEGEIYLGDLNRLDQKILDTEKAISINQKSLDSLKDLEALKEKLVLLKANYEAWNYSTKIEAQIDYANNKGWKNVSAYLNQIANACQENVRDEYFTDDCFLRVAEFKEFIKGRSILNSEREDLNTFADHYSKNLESRMTINTQFMDDLNKLIDKTNPYFSFKVLPLVTVKMGTVPKVPILIPLVHMSKERSNHYFVEDITFVQVAVVFLSVMSMIVLGIYFKKKKCLKKVRQFYSKIYFSAKRCSVDLKIFGNINDYELSILSKIEQNIIDVISSASCVGSMAVMRFKRNQKHIILETKLEDVCGIQDKLGKDDSEIFTSKIIALQQKTQALGGEFIFTELFNEKGENISSSYSVVFPV